MARPAQPVTPDHGAVVLHVLAQSPHDDCRVHCAGLLGCVALHPALHASLAPVGAALLTVLARDDNGWSVGRSGAGEGME